MTTLFTYASGAAHTQAGHPEHAGRTQAIRQLLEDEGALADLLSFPPRPAQLEQLLRVHDKSMIERVRQVSLAGGGMLDADTYTTAASYEEALLAAGSCCAAVDQVMSGAVQNALAVIRPPGHHAERRRVGGFCLFNNAAVAARQAQVVHGVERVLIVDFDVHHGNGTQDIFYEDKSVLFVSLHQYGRYFYPGTGAAQEMGVGDGRGFTLNVPLPLRVGDRGYGRIFDELIRPKAAAFKPGMIIVSAGFDAHWADPLASQGLTLTGYAQLSRALIEMADAWCDGRILFVLEGGYLLQALAYGVLNLAYALNGRDRVQDPLGPLPQAETAVDDLLNQLKQLHLLN